MALPDKPITRREMYLSNMAGQGTPLPEAPITREEAYLDVIAKQGGGGGTGDGDMKKSVYDNDLAVMNAGGIKSFVAAQTAGKVDKVTGKGLSTNDYDDTEKAKVADAFPRSEQAVLGSKNIFDKKQLQANGTTITQTENGFKIVSTSAGTWRSVIWNFANTFKNTEWRIKTTANITAGKALISVRGSNDSTNWTSIKDSATLSQSGNIDITYNTGSYAYIRVQYFCTAGTSESGDVTYVDTMCYLATDPDDTYVPYAMTNKELTENKADKVTNAANGNFAGLDSNGNLTDSGKSSSDFLPSNTPIPAVSIAETGTASASTTRQQQLTIDNVSTDISGSKYMEQTINAQANTDTTFTFTNAALTYASVLDIFAGCKTADYDIPTLKSKTLSVSGSTGTLTLVYNVPTAYALTVRVYIRG